MKDKSNKVYSVIQPDESPAVEYADANGQYPDAKGKLFKKRIINLGEYADQWFPEYSLKLDQKWADEVLANFKAGTVGRVYVPAGHTDDPELNRGEVIDMFMSEDGKGIDAIIDIRSDQTVADIDEGRIWDVSIGFTMNWIDKEGEEKGAAIYHVALVNNPYMDDLTPFEAFSKVVSECRESFAKSYKASAIMLSRTGIKKEFSMENVTIKNDKDYEVKTTITVDGKEEELTIAAGAEVEVPEDQKEAVEKAIAESTAPEADEDAEEEEDKDKDAQTDEQKELSKLRKENAEFRKKEVDAKYSALLKDGKIVPAQEKAFKAIMATEGNVEFSRDGKSTQVPVSELMTELFSHAPKLVKYSEEGNNGEGKDKQEEGQTPYDSLSDKDKAGLKATGVSKERYNDAVAKHPELYPEHQTEEQATNSEEDSEEGEE